MQSIKRNRTVEGLLFHATQKLRTGDKADLASLVKLAGGSGLISVDTARVCDVIRDWRNLIHPERQMRLGIRAEDLPQKAKAAKAVLETVVLDLEKSNDRVFTDGKFGVPIDWQEPRNDQWVSWDSKMQFEGKDTLRVEGKGDDDIPRGIPNAWMMWRIPIRRKRFFRALIYLRPELAPGELMFQFHQSASEEGSEPWAHRVYWGRDLEPFDRTDLFKHPRRKVGDIPELGKWHELSVDLKNDAMIDIEKGIDGIAITLVRVPGSEPRAVWFGRSAFASTRSN